MTVERISKQTHRIKHNDVEREKTLAKMECACENARLPVP
jgi:hypothetical protein